MNWLSSPSHFRFLDAEMDRLLEFGRASKVADGFGWLDSTGKVDASKGVQLWITSRMTHVYALAALAGRPGSLALAEHGVASLLGPLHDDENGGWFAGVGPKAQRNTAKEAYGHAFVILAASSAHAAGVESAKELLTDAIEIHSERFWEADYGMSRESFAADWSGEEDYRGINANMHTVEAYLAAADVLGDHDLLRRALRIASRAINVFARENEWHLPEHFSATWVPDLDYNKDAPAHPFRPYGATIGHLFEWARLVTQLGSALQQAGLAAPDWIEEAARELYAAAVAQGWAADGEPGFVYTVDWEGTPVVRERMHWVAAEAAAAAAVLWNRTRQERYATDYRRWWDFIGAFHVDRAGGSWWHELSASNEPSSTVWDGKADTYHGVQATLFPRLPVSPALAASLAAGNLN